LDIAFRTRYFIVKVYIVFFQREDYPEPVLENIFATKELAKKYIKIEKIKRDLSPAEIWAEEKEVVESDIDF